MVIEMDKCTVALNSLTYCIKAQKLLNENYIYSDVVKMDARRAKNGCAYGLEINCNDEKAIRGILEKSKISIKHYFKSGGGERI